MELTDPYIFEKTVEIDATTIEVWHALTNTTIMKEWMGSPEIKLTIETDWQIGHPIIISGFHHVPFQAKGIVLEFKSGSIISYSHLSSVSRLADEEINYSVLTFTLHSAADKTLLTLTITNFPTETIFQHLRFYWNVTLELFKRFVERGADLWI